MELQPLTLLLKRWRSGDRDARDQLISNVHEHLTRLAGRYMRRERPDHTLDTSALVNELYLRLSAGENIEWHDRVHFFAVAAQQLRRILVNHARDAHALKRGGNRVKLSLTQVPGLAEDQVEDVLHVHEALEELEKLDARAARVVELRFFGGLTEEETAEEMNVSVATSKRAWRFARAWLKVRLSGESSAE